MTFTTKSWPIGCFSLLALLAGCAEKPPEAEVVRPVVTVTIEEPSLTIERTFSGIAKGEIDSNLSFRVGGEIRSLPARIGARVKVGDVIARLDPTDYELKLGQARAMLAQVRAQFVGADADFTRAKSLYENDNVSKSALDTGQAAYESAKAQMEASEKQVEQAVQQLNYTILLAPQDGSIGEVPVEINQVVQPGQVIASLVSEDKIEMHVGIPESLITRVKVGSKAVLNFESVPGEILPAVVSKVGIDTSTTSTYEVQISMLKHNPLVRPGMVGEAVLIFERPASERFITVPLVAVAGRLEERYVWVFSPAGAGVGNVAKRPVSVGDLTTSGLQIREGIKPGEIIVVRGVHRLEEGIKVKLLQNFPN